jgi:hypothetical protein
MLGEDLKPHIFTLANNSPNWAHTTDLRKGVSVLQVATPSAMQKPRNYFGFYGGYELSGAQIMTNKILGARFANVNNLSWAHNYLGVSDIKVHFLSQELTHITLRPLSSCHLVTSPSSSLSVILY